MRLIALAVLVIFLSAFRSDAEPSRTEQRGNSETGSRAYGRPPSGGILEEHGPYLPSYSDGFQSEFVATRLAETIVARPGWTVLRFPVIPLGTMPANDIGREFTFAGSYPVRMTTRAPSIWILLTISARRVSSGFSLSTCMAPLPTIVPWTRPQVISMTHSTAIWGI